MTSEPTNGNGVNFFGPFEAKDSIGRVASLNIECLKMAYIMHEVYLLSRPAVNQKINYGTIDDKLISSLKYNVNLFHFNARRVPLYFSRLGEESLKGFYNIGFWVHEMKVIPNQWARQLEFFDEIWTPSSLCQNSIALSANIPVIKMPYPIEANPIATRMEKINEGQKLAEFNFLAIFDVQSDAERKNPLFMAKAFLAAHAGNEKVKLIIKTRNLKFDETLHQKLRKITEENPNVIVIDGYLHDEQLSKLYDEADAYVSLHRAEGFGLTISDAMSRGIPVLVTGYSGNMDFCNAAESRVVSYDLVEVGHDRPRYRINDVWAEPDLDDATLAFKDLVQNHRFWVNRAIRARNNLQRDFSVGVVGEQMKARLELIANKFAYSDDMTNRIIDHEVGISKTYGF
jgi:glycosyltransferase involved in cell wall biosynthesis